MVTLHATIRDGADPDQCIRDITRELRRMMQCLAVKRSLPALRAHRERRIGAAIIQRNWRLHRDWTRFKQYYLTRKAAATKIQALFRRTRVPRWQWFRRQRWGEGLSRWFW